MKVGDRVQWTHVSQRGKTLSMSLREGVIEKIETSIVEYAVIMRSGVRERVLVSQLRSPGEKSQISEFVEAMRGE